ncbi:ATPase, T2SS/T4P/T4SS family [Candidatus Methanarcanum hacksteinii]|uniref:ATPase, T2SS/T4P/T4SS family n=1 Tax=Candidatus Methanarcanum hacksteinii TaxID=2911857 RepID=UPI002A89E3C3|nr:type II/IV secretion system ATPase subunit [Methanomassiliicoccales archaeon]MDY4581032.1 type II/IV secretion system ATPase subunit [Candidatus Methanarcanum hacksteinii]
MPRIVKTTISPDSGRIADSNGVPISDDDPDVVKQGDDISFKRKTIEEILSNIDRRYRMIKPPYADTWSIGDNKDIAVLEKYRTNHSRIIIGDADDGEIEYNIMPNEYTYSLSLSDLVNDTISYVRDEYRKDGGRFNTNDVRRSAEEFLIKNRDIIDDAISGGCSFEYAIRELCDVVVRYTIGLGIFELLLEDPRLEDIYIDAPCDKNRIYVTLDNVSGYNTHMRCRTNLIASEREIRNLINTLMRDSGLPYCESSPVMETNMCNNQARATIVGYPMSPNGDSVAIRKHSTTPWTLTKLIGNGTIDEHDAGLISFLVDNRCTFLVCGARGAGKSSLLSAMLFEMPIEQRILTIEDTLELPGDVMRSMGYKVQSMLIDERMNSDVSKRADEALRVSLRLGESAIILGEVRGDEARTLYQSMRAGRAGSSIMGTIHGDSAKGVYERVVHDIGIPAESFMATDFLIVMGTRRERGTNRQTRKIVEFVSTSDTIGEFISVDKGMYRSPAMRRIMESTSMAKGDVEQEIKSRAKMRGLLSKLAIEVNDGYSNPEWIILANDHLSRCISSGITDSDDVLESFKKKLGVNDQ